MMMGMIIYLGSGRGGGAKVDVLEVDAKKIAFGVDMPLLKRILVVVMSVLGCTYHHCRK